MVDCSIYHDADLPERRADAKRRLYDYFGVKDGDTNFKWTFSNWDKCQNRDELPHSTLPVSKLDTLASGWKTTSERWQWHNMLKEANPSDICISTNHMLMIAAIMDDCTPFAIMESA